MKLFRWLFGGAGKMSEVSHALHRELDLAEIHSRNEFPQCTAAEQRDMAAMGRSEMFRQAAGRLPFDHPYRSAWFATSHIWLVTGMVLQRDRKKELPHAVRAEAWFSLEARPDLQAWLSSLALFKDEQTADATAAELWERLGLPVDDRPWVRPPAPRPPRTRRLHP